MVILVVEDSSAMRQLIVHALRKIAGAVIIEAADGGEGLEKLGEIQPDVIMTDINMPVMDGFAFIQRVRELPNLARTPIIVLTTEGAEDDRRRAETLGVTTYVTKPIRAHDLLAAVASVTDLDAPAAGTASGPPAVVLRVDYANAEDLVSDYSASLGRGEIVVSNGRVLEEGTRVRLALAFPSLAEPIHLDGVVQRSRAGAEPTLDIRLTDVQQREQLAHLITRIRAANPR